MAAKLAPYTGPTSGPNFNPEAAARGAGFDATQSFVPPTPVPPFGGSDPDKAAKLAKKAAKKGPFQGTPQFQGPVGDVLNVPLDQKGRIDKKARKRFEQEQTFAYRPGQFAATAAPSAYQQGVFDPNSPNYFNTAAACAPECNQHLVWLVQRPLEQQRDESIRALSERFANLGRVGSGRFGQGAINIQENFGNALSDAVTRIALQQALGERAERLLSEERDYGSAETERNRRFAASQGGFDRDLARSQISAGGGGSVPAAINAGGGGGIGQQLLAAITGGAASRIF
jgi:hypothetical protein